MAQQGVRRTVLVGVVVVLVASGLWWRSDLERWIGLSQPTAVAATVEAAVPVTVVTAHSQPIRKLIEGIGTVAALQSVVVVPQLAGEITAISFNEGDEVEKGTVLAQIDARQVRANLASSEAKVAQDRALLATGQADAARYSALAAKGVIATSVLDQKNSDIKQLDAEIKADEAAISNANTQLGFATIAAPISGRMGFRQVDVGSVVGTSSSTGIVTITQMDPIGVSFVAPGDRFGEIRDALKAGIADVEIGATDGSRSLATGKLTVMDNAVDATNGSIHLRATFDNAAQGLWPGLPVSTRLTVAVEEGIVVPDKALARGADGLYAYVVGTDGKAERRPVEAPFVTDAQALVTKGLAEGDQVVMDGRSRLGDGTPVAATPWQGTASGSIAGTEPPGTAASPVPASSDAGAEVSGTAAAASQASR